MGVLALNKTYHHDNSATYDSGDIAVSILSSVLLWILVPGCSFMYSGGGKRQSALTTLMMSMWGLVIVTVQWWALGYSLAFSSSGGPFIGNLDNVFLIGVYDKPGIKPAGTLPEMAFCLYQGVTAALGPGFIFGVTADRGRLMPALVFTLLWSTLVYDVVAYWTLNPHGWGALLGVLDYGGGAPVHVPVGAAALAYTMILGPTQQKITKPHNMSNVFLGTILIWIGSFGYNAGSAYRSNIVAVMTCVNTNLAASASAIVWVALDYCRVRNFSAFGFCLGAVVGLVSIVPASGYVSTSSSVAIGAISTVVCYAVYCFRDRFFFDDVMDVVVVNGMGGLMGNVLAGIFSEKFYGGDEVGQGGWMEGHWMQVPYQLANSAATFTLSFVVSFVLLFAMNKTKVLKLRASAEEEVAGIDETELGVNCYEFFEDALKGTQVPPDTQVDKQSKVITISNGIGIERNDSTNIRANREPANQNSPLRNNWLFN